MDHNTKKRTNTALLGPKRVPLAETNSNVPLPALKKQKLAVQQPSRHRLPQEDSNLTVDALNAQQDENRLTDLAAQDRHADDEHIARASRKVEEQSATSAAISDANTAHSTNTSNTASTNASAAASAHANAQKSARLVGDELKRWQDSWRKIMRESVVYFDTQGCDSNNQAQHQEQKRAQRALKLVGCEIVPFYDRDVSIIVSRRPFNPSKTYPPNDILNDAISLKIKVWDYDKVFRFLKNLGVSDTASQDRTGNLSNLLREEKIFGSNDRDPNAKRDDLHYLEKHFIYIFDLAQAVRPIAVREWPSESFPSFNLTLDGKCPFIPDASDNLERKKLRRLQKFDATKKYRELLRKVTDNIIGHSHEKVRINSHSISGQSTSTVDDGTDENTTEVESAGNDQLSDGISEEEKKIALEFKAPPATLTRNSSVMTGRNNSAVYPNSKVCDVAASGFNGASNAQSVSVDSALNSAAQMQGQQGNGLGPLVSQVPSKNLNNLKRRIFMKKHLQKSEGKLRERELKPGYCENCRVKYDHFDDHIMSNRHRNFACNDENFQSIDDLIATLNESKSMGFVASNGDFRYV